MKNKMKKIFTIILCCLAFCCETGLKAEVLAQELETEKYITEGYTMENLSVSQRWRVQIPTDLSSYNGFSYHVDTSETSQVEFFHQLTELGGEEWKSNAISATQVAFFYPDDGSDYFWGRVNYYPAGFKGKVVVPFTSFRTVNPQDKVFDTANLDGELVFIVSVATGGSITVKDIQLVTDAKTVITMEYYPQRIEGDYGSANYFAIHKAEVLAGADKFIPKEIDGYYFDENNSKNNLNNYANSAEKNFIKVGLCGSGMVAGSYRPIVYYKRIPQVIEKVFGLENVKSSYPEDTYTQTIMADFPKGGIVVGTERKELLQLMGEWKAIKREQDSLTVVFHPTNMPETVIDENRILTVVIAFTPVENNWSGSGENMENSGFDSENSSSTEDSSVVGKGCGGTLFYNVGWMIFLPLGVVALLKGGKKQ